MLNSVNTNDTTVPCQWGKKKTKKKTNKNK